MTILKSDAEIEIMRQANQIVAEVFNQLRSMIRPGISTMELDQAAEALILRRGAKPAFKGYSVGGDPFPATLCVSINEEVVHGIPSKERFLATGDIVSIDCGAVFNGFYGDCAKTFPVGVVSEIAASLLRVAEEALHRGIHQVKVGNRIGDVSSAIQSHCEAHGFSIVRDYVGHGVGRDLHEGPQIPNFGAPHTGVRLKKGMVLAIEPMVNVGSFDVEQLDDGWTVVTKDRQLSAHFEHSVAVTDGGPLILSDWPACN